MKRAVVVLIVLLALAGIVVFGISRFDVNGFQPKIKEQLETLTGNPVNLGKLSLAWREGLTLRLDGLQVYSRGDTSGRPAISLESASVVLRLLPLLQGKFQAASLTIKKPEFQVARDKNGGVILEGLNPQPSEIASPKPDAGKSVPVFPVSFYIRKIRIEDGRMLYLDASGPSPLSVSVRSLDANLLDFSFSKMNDLSFSAETAMAVFAAAKNLTMHGNCRWLHRESSLVLE
ncbi:MAG: AsmA family protein, partial [Candidatus Omnitrophota bacterium]